MEMMVRWMRCRAGIKGRGDFEFQSEWVVRMEFGGGGRICGAKKMARYECWREMRLV